jgi:hypothetical protein
VPTKVWAPGESVLSTDFNAMVQEQVIPTFATAAARDSAMPAPKVGQFCFVADPGVLMQYTDRSVVAGWHRPWDQPWGALEGDTVIVPDSSISWGQFFVNAGYTCPTPRRMVRIQYEFWLQKQVDGNDAHCYVRMINARDGGMIHDRLATLHQGWTAPFSITSTADSSNVTGTHIVGYCTWGWYNTAWIRRQVTDLGPAPVVQPG